MTVIAPPRCSLAGAVTAALDGDLPLPALAVVRPRDRHDALVSLLTLLDLHVAPLAAIGDRVRLQHQPDLTALQLRLQDDFLADLDSVPVPGDLPGDPVEAMRALAARDRLPEVYKWLAKTASYAELVEFLTVEGGPDGGFDDLVAACQIGLDGAAKLELAVNYWDEMGNGDGAAVHTELHRDMARALGIREIPRDSQSTEALARTALCSVLAVNRWLQPEMLGALGLTELQAGPRCRLVLQGFDRVGVPRAAYPFYEVHAEVDPRHGKDWVEKAIAPTVARWPEWGPRIVRGAWWRARVNAEFFAASAPVAVVAA